MESETSVSRPKKRAKYTSAACLQCKQRKAKCVRNSGEEHCERCRSFGETCTFPQTQPSPVDADDRFAKVEDVIQTMQRRMDQLQHELDAVRRSTPRSAQRSSTLQTPGAGAESRRRHRQLPFVGRTQPAFGIDVARSSMREMGLANDAPEEVSAAASPEPELSDTVSESLPPLDPLHSLPKHEVVDAIATFRDEVHSVYPFVDIDELFRHVENYSAAVEQPRPSSNGTESLSTADWDCEELLVLRVAVAVGKVIHSLGANNVSQRLVDFVESRVFGSRLTSQANYFEAVAVALISLYYFHIDQELLAWRTIGFAAHMALELGLHRSDGLLKNFAQTEKRAAAVKLFWCIYVLDRRWSIGVSLPFTLQDADIDPELPEPKQDAAYLQCMIQYGRIVSKVWHAFPSFGPHTKPIPEETVSFLEFKIHSWIESIPPHLRLSNVQTNLDANDGVNSRLRALLYLRGIHLRILINRHHILSTANIRNDPHGAQRVVDLAKDAIQVLVELNERSMIYMSQQVAFNFFLVSSLAAIFLAVCHEPSTFGAQCRDTFFNAGELVRGLSVRSRASRRLWQSIRRLQGEAQKLGLHRTNTGAQHFTQPVTASGPDRRIIPAQHNLSTTYQATSEAIPQALGGSLPHSLPPYTSSGNDSNLEPTLSGTDVLPNIDQITSCITNWYELFDQPEENGNIFDTLAGGLDDEPGVPLVDRGEFSRLLQELLSG